MPDSFLWPHKKPTGTFAADKLQVSALGLQTAAEHIDYSQGMM